MRRFVIPIGFLVLLLISIAVWRRSRHREMKETPKFDTIVIESSSPKKSNSISGGVAESTAEPNPAAARRALGKALSSFPADCWLYYSTALEEMHDGAYPEYRRFARDFLAMAGRDVVPIVESLLAECRSREARYLLVSVLGDARRAEAVPLLKRLIDENPDRWTTKSALFSIGMANTEEGFDFLAEFTRSGKVGNPAEGENHWTACFAALGQHGNRALDFLLEEARRNKTENRYPNPYIIGGIRGKDAIQRLESLLRTDPDPMIRLGAAMALASTTDPAQLHSLASLDPNTAGRALLAARNRPDIWNASAATRVKVAERIFSAAGSPTGNYQQDSALLEAAMFLPPERTRALMESLLAKPPRYMEREEDLTRFVAAFADQPDVIQRAHELKKAWGRNASGYDHLLDDGMKLGLLPGRELHPATLEKLFDVVGNPASNEAERQLAMSTLMLARVPEQTQSEALSRIWSQPISIQQKREILGAIGGGGQSSASTKGPILGTRPDRFLSDVIQRETQEPLLQAWAARAYYSGDSQLDNPVSQRVLDVFLRHARGTTGQDSPDKHPITHGMISFAVVAHFAKNGNSADLPTLNRWGSYFAGEWGGEAARRYQDQMNYAIDAIRLSGR